MTAFDLILIVLAAIVLVPMAVLVVECCFAFLPLRHRNDAERPTCAVLVPAHDEEIGLPKTIADLKSQLLEGDRLLVVADNCSDATAAVARAHGAEVLERHDPDRKGKGFALAAGIDALRAGPPEVVVIVDADCRPDPNAIDRLAKAADQSGRPIQAVYLLDFPPGADVRTRLSSWAVQLKNLVRPLGLRRLGAPCLLTGSGMAFPWRLLRDAPLASHHIVEDMQLGIDLAIAGHSPDFEPEAVIRGELPNGPKASTIQRTRWEHGHLSTLLSQSPRLIYEAFKQRRAELAGLALELGVPPLSALAVIWLAVLVISSFAGMIGASWLPAQMLIGGGLATGVAGLAAWMRFGRDVLPPSALLAAPLYVACKMPLYIGFLFRPQRNWVRTPRSEPPAGPTGEVAQ